MIQSSGTYSDTRLQNLIENLDGKCVDRGKKIKIKTTKIVNINKLQTCKYQSIQVLGSSENDSSGNTEIVCFSTGTLQK